MLDERYTQSIPDELPDGILDEGNPEQRELWEQIRSLHQQLRLEISTNQRRRQQLFDEHEVLLRRDNEHVVRLNLLIDQFIGRLSPERFEFELQWQKVIAASLEDAFSQVVEQKREQRNSKELHLPGGKLHVVKPTVEESNGDESDA